MRSALAPGPAALLAAILGLSAGSRAAAAPGTPVLLISVDGLRPADYLGDGAAAVPNLRALTQQGTYATGAVSVMPAVTFPAHTTIITGVDPARHGIVNNRVFDPGGEQLGAWHWYYQDIKAPTLFTWARAAGLKTASVTWPVTAGAPVDLLLPDMYPVGSLREAKNLMGLARGLEDAELLNGPLAHPERLVKMKDDLRVAVAEHLLRKRPDLMALHFLDLDTAQHLFGPGSAEARASLESIDLYLGRLFDVLRAEDRWESTTVVVVSDHGFATVRPGTEIRVGTLLRALGLVQVDTQGRATAGQAFVWSAGGTAAIVLGPAATAQDRRRVDGVVKLLLDDPTLGVARALRGNALAAFNGFSAPAGCSIPVVLEARPGFYFGGRHDLPELLGPAVDLGTHGFAPDQPEMRAAFLLRGPGIQRGKRLGLVRLTDVAPTIARVLGLRTPAVDGRVLTEVFVAAPVTRAPR